MSTLPTEEEPLDISEVRRVHRITIAHIFRSLFDAFNMDRGGIYTAKQLFINPGKAVRDYLGANRYHYTPPFRILIITTALALFAIGLSEFTEAAEAQFSAAFHADVSDINNDGNEDLFISQNFFGVANPQQKPRLDSGRGLWMTGDGTGNLESIPGHISGIKVYGEQRGTAVSDFNRDGKADITVSQHQAETKLFKNVSGSSGILVSLKGPKSNQNGYGSSVRVIYEDGTKGPLRTIHAGSGYWSQSSALQILGRAGEVSSVEVTWFDGSIKTVDLSEGQMFIEIEY